MATTYTSALTGQQIDALENNKVSKTGSSAINGSLNLTGNFDCSGSVSIGSLNCIGSILAGNPSNTTTNYTITCQGNKGNISLNQYSNGVQSLNSYKASSSTYKDIISIDANQNITYTSGNFNGPISIGKQNSSSEGGEIVLEPATSSYSTVYLDSFQNNFRVHNGSTEKIKVDMATTGGLSINFANSVSWHKTREAAINIINSSTGSGAQGAISIKTRSGAWSICDYNTEALYFTYCTDANYNANSNSTVQGRITSAGAFTNASKRALKENILDFKKSATDIINSVKICSFNMKGDPEKDYRVGFIADDTDPILSGKNQDIMDLQNCIGVMMKAIQELSNEIETLKQKLNS